MGTDFDKIAKKSTGSSKSASNKVAAVASDLVKRAVDKFIKAKAAEKKAKSDKGSAEQVVLDAVIPQYLELGRKGDFTKSLEVAGSEEGVSVTFVAVDKFSVPQDEDTQTSIRDLIGEEKFESFFQTVRAISLKKSAIEDEKTLQKICDACEKAGLDIGAIFDVGDKLVAKDDLDRKQLALDEDKLTVFHTLVKQNKPSLR